MQTSLNRNKNSSRRLDSTVGVLNPRCFQPGLNQHSQLAGLPFHYMQRVSLGVNIKPKRFRPLWGGHAPSWRESQIWLPSTAITFTVTDGLPPFPCLARGTHWYSQWQTDDQPWPLSSAHTAVIHLETSSLPRGPFPIPAMRSYLPACFRAHAPLICQRALQEYKPRLISD